MTTPYFTNYNQDFVSRILQRLHLYVLLTNYYLTWIGTMCLVWFLSPAKKAFDFIDHQLLLRKLKTYGVLGNDLENL